MNGDTQSFQKRQLNIYKIALAHVVSVLEVGTIQELTKLLPFVKDILEEMATLESERETFLNLSKAVEAFKKSHRAPRTNLPNDGENHSYYKDPF